ncbi:MAG: hypothetical protein ACRDJE_13175 [Dehalococcoidia bacterium]
MPESKNDPVKDQGDGHAQQAAASDGAVPARIDLDDFIEAVARGVARSMPEQDEVSGYLLNSPSAGPIIIGLVFPLPDRFGPKPGPIMPVPPVTKKVE